MSVTLPAELLETAQMSESEMMTEIAIMLYQQQRIPLEKAAQLIGMGMADFYQLLISRKIITPSTVPDDEPLELIVASLNTSLGQIKEGKIHPISELWDGIDV